MTHFYYYIEAGRELSTDSNFFRVAVGTNAQAQRDYLFLIAYSVEHAHYFERFSPDSDSFISRVAESIQVPRLPFVQLTARQLVRYFKNAAALPVISQQRLDSAAHQDAMLNLDYYIAAKVLNCRV